MTEWQFNGQQFTEQTRLDLCPKAEGFVYLIENIETGKKYIGRKYFTNKRKWKKTDKRRSTKPSNWLDYWGSSDLLKADIEKLGKDKFTRRILVICQTRGDTNTNEVKYLWANNVLDDDGTNWYNGSIGSRKRTPKHIVDGRIYSQSQ